MPEAALKVKLTRHMANLETIKFSKMASLRIKSRCKRKSHIMNKKTINMVV
jgi:hypothetical protein